MLLCPVFNMHILIVYKTKLVFVCLLAAYVSSSQRSTLLLGAEADRAAGISYIT